VNAFVGYFYFHFALLWLIGYKFTHLVGNYVFIV
jgi:hypothetical protein